MSDEEAQISAEVVRALEGILLVAMEPVDPTLLAQLLEQPIAVVEGLCERLSMAYAEAGHGFQLVKVAGGYRFQSHPDVSAYVERFVLDSQQARISSAALETLAIIAYKQPVTRGDIESIRGVTDKVIQALMNLLPSHLPARMREYRERYEHHLLLRVSNDTLEQTRAFLAEYFAGSTSGAFFECDAEEGRKAFLHRFAIAGAAIRYREAHRASVEDIVALDIALRRNDRDWVEKLPAELEEQIVHKLYYGHFFCHVFHQDYIVKKGVDPLAMEHRMWELLDERRAEYPAEHNVGHLYVAKPALAGFYQSLDPTNTFNPGIGHTPRGRDWQECNHASGGWPKGYSENA